MIKKISVTIILVFVIIIMGVVIANFNAPNKCVYAKSINVENNNLTISQNECIENESLGIEITPNTYNQTIRYFSSNEDCVYFDEENNLHSSSVCGNAQISIFVKSAKDETISTTINVVIENDNEDISYKDSFLQSKIVEFERFSCGYNVLSLANNPIVSISYKNNLVNYDYVSGKISLNKSLSTFAYDEVYVTLTYSNRAVQNLSFKVIVVDVVNLSLNENHTIYFKNTNPTFYSLNYECSNSLVISAVPSYNRIDITATKEGICYYTITGYDFIYKTKIIVSA